jgi:hypothetical protein
MNLETNPENLFQAYPVGALDLFYTIATSIALRHGVTVTRDLLASLVSNDVLWDGLRQRLEPDHHEQLVSALAMAATPKKPSLGVDAQTSSHATPGNMVMTTTTPTPNGK